MGKTKSFINNIEITQAQRKHSCKHNKNHTINAGEKRLTLKVNQNYENFCKECAKISLRADIEKLKSLLNELESGIIDR